VSIVLTAVVVASALLVLPSVASAEAEILSFSPTPGTEVDKADGTPAITGVVSGDTAEVLVAIKNNTTGRWWHRGSCAGNGACAAGTFKTAWTRSAAVLSVAGNQQNFSFPADLPPGNFQIGIRTREANGSLNPAGAWYGITVVNTASVSPASGSPAANETVNQGQVTISHGQNGSAFDGCCFGTSQLAVKRHADNTWLQADRTWAAGYHVFDMNVDAVGLFGAQANFTFDADQPGRYGYWIDNYDDSGQKWSAGWASFNVAACSSQCANIENLGGVSVGPDGVCFSGSLRGPSPRFTVLQVSTGTWLQGAGLDPQNPTFGPWNWFNTLSSLIQADTDLDSCFNDPPLVLPAGDYFVGIRVFDGAGNEGPGKWIPITIA
jgi:hypothetical protein